MCIASWRFFDLLLHARRFPDSFYFSEIRFGALTIAVFWGVVLWLACLVPPRRVWSGKRLAVSLALAVCSSVILGVRAFPFLAHLVAGIGYGGP
jgi:hypothetical protein